MAVFTAYEIKAGTQKLTTHQEQFINIVLQAGGIAKEIREEDLG